MNIVIFLLLIIIIMGLIYIVHRYFGKHELYLLDIIYCILSFLLSFKLINIFGININLGIIFNCGVIMIIYYFVNRFSKNDLRKIIITSIISILSCIILLVMISLMEGSLYDENIILLKDLLFDNWLMSILYPIGLIITLLLSSYGFNELKRVEKRKKIKTIMVLIGVTFVDVFLVTYFAYVTKVKYSVSLLISIDNYFVKAIILILMYLVLDRIMKIKKVKP